VSAAFGSRCTSQKIRPAFGLGGGPGCGPSTAAFSCLFFPKHAANTEQGPRAQNGRDGAFRGGRNGCARTVLSIRQEFAEGLTKRLAPSAGVDLGILLIPTIREYAQPLERR
jgi:hypothetical protein